MKMKWQVSQGNVDDEITDRRLIGSLVRADLQRLAVKTCRAAGLKPGCCTGSKCFTGYCYCDRKCHNFEDCCMDVLQECKGLTSCSSTGLNNNY